MFAIINMYYDLISGAVAGIISRTAVAPIELYRIQRQNSFIPSSTLKDVVKKEGVRHLWKGNGTNCIRVVPQLALNWSIYNKINLVPGEFRPHVCLCNNNLYWLYIF